MDCIELFAQGRSYHTETPKLVRGEGLDAVVYISPDLERELPHISQQPGKGSEGQTHHNQPADMFCLAHIMF